MLIQFKISIHQKNIELHKYLMLANKSHNKSKQHAILRIGHLKTSLIFSISTWYINVQQGVISTKDIRNSLGDFLTNEYLILFDYIKAIAKDRSSKYHNDAINCQNLFKYCANIGNEGDR